MKKISLFLTVLVLAVTLPTFAAAKTVTCSGASGEPGNQVTISITVDDLSGIAGYNIDFTYDSTVLTANTAAVGADFPGYLFIPNLGTAGEVKLTMAGALANSSTDPGELATVTFTINNTAFKSSAITFTKTDLKDGFGASLPGVTSDGCLVEVTGVTVTVELTCPGQITVGAPDNLTAEVLVNGAHLDLTSVDDITFASDGSGAFGDKTLVGGNVQVPYTPPTTPTESATITATETLTLNDNQDSCMIDSVPDVCATLTVSPDTATLTADQTQQFDAACVDQYGNATDKGTLTWSGGAAIGTIGAGTGLFDATTVGTDTVTATSDLGPADNSGTITVTPGVLTTLIVTPDTATITADETQQFNVAGTDADGNAADLGTITWTGGAVIGTIGADTGLLDATTVGTDSVTATSSIGPSDTTGDVNVTPGAPASIELVSSRDKVASGGKGTSDLTATVKDADGNVKTDLPATAIEYTVTGPGVANAGWTTNEADTANGVATVVFTTQGEVPEPGSTTVDVVAEDKVGGLGLTSNSVTLTIVNFSIDIVAPGEPFVDAEGVHLVTSGSTPTTATFKGVGGDSGDYRWALASCGNISSTTADEITYTAPATIDGDDCEDTLTLTSEQDPSLEDSVDVTIYNPVAITWPTSEAGIALGDDSYAVTASGGTSAYAYQSSDAGVGAVDENGNITPVAVGVFTVKARDDAYGAFDTANGFLAETMQIEIVNPIVIGDTPASDSLQSEETNPFSATGGKDDGQVDWEATAGTIDENGLYTAPTVTAQEGSVDVTITAYDKTYNKDSDTPVMTQYTLTVYATLTIVPEEGFDAEAPLAPGDETTFTAVGGDGDCTWSVNGEEILNGGACMYTFVAPSGVGTAGVYEIEVTDGNGFTSTFEVMVSLEIIPGAFSFTETTTVDFQVDGANSDYTWEILDAADANTEVANPDDYGTWTKASPVVGDNTNTFNPADVEEVTTFFVRVTVTGDDDLTEENGLNKIVGGPYYISPVAGFAGTIVDEAGVGIDGATVELTYPTAYNNVVQADANGEFAFILPDTGTSYQFRASEPGFVTASFTSDDLSMVDPAEALITLLTADALATIEGDVTVGGGEPTGHVYVQAYRDLDGPVFAGIARAGSPYRFDFETDNAPYTVTASIPGYVDTEIVPAVPANDVDLDLQETTGEQCVDAGSGGLAVFVDGDATAVTEVPLGVVDREGGATTEVCFALTVVEEMWACNAGAGDIVYEVVAEDQDGFEVTFLGDFAVTLEFDLADVPPGGFESGESAIYQAADLGDCDTVELIDPGQIIAADYVGDGFVGTVTFLTDHLSDFGVGAGGGATRLKDNSDDDRCFIATAAYGSPFDKHVKVLRKFKKVYLMPTMIGRTFVDAYYSLSPPVADFIADHDPLRALVRFALLPFVGMSYMMLHAGLFGSLLILASMLALCAGLWKMGRGRMKKGALIAVPLLLVCLMAAGSAEARQEGYYGGLNLVYAFENIDEDDTEDKFEGPINIDFDDSWGVQLRLGYIYNEYFSLEGMYEYIAAFEADDGGLDDDLDVMNFTVNGKLTCPAYESFVPYVIVGIGAMNAYEDISYKGDSSEESEWGLGARAGLGFDYYFQPEWSAEVEVAYVFGTGDVDNVKYTTLGAGIAYHW